ncbi:hypothetical protein [Winogradskyella jejuensis]|uniref:Lipoprotein n=1 Tax=Winogradskyella jejuensis TaxID=1089305 RepID=A0A1M5VYZ1_9FLAO|nr:hypothetical protein [Winogradskyella jejuensis]SHH80214.1 hypothetical protein SAMN05444148_2853 [Winogradskyella jejuensis]
MNRIIEKGTYFIIIITLLACNTNKVIINDTEVNTYPNPKYKKSRKAYSGTLNKTEYDELIKKLEVELKTTFPTNKSILINYNQKAPNCIGVRFSEKEKKQIANNRIRISSRMSSNYNAIDFFVYTEDSYNKEIYEQMNEFITDSGFFYDTVFTEHQNCSGFFIIKTNGEFYKHYGEDYYSEVKAFFEKK